MEAVKESQSTKKGFFSRLRRSKTGNVATDANKAESDPAAMTTDEGGQPSQPTGTQSQSATVTREGLPIISSNADGFKPSEVRQNNKRVKKGVTMERKSVILEKAPAARDAAFGGPPRYDWIDIETAAAIKVQSVFRRKKVMDELESQGLETTAMRNRRRRRGARKNKSTNEDSPGLFQCCGLGLIFGDASEEDEKARREFEKAQYEEKKRQQFEREAALRTYRPRVKGSTNIQESIEIIE